MIETVSVFDFMTAAQRADVQADTALIDVTDAWEKAQAAAWRILIPAGTHLLDNFRPRQGKQFIGEGYYTSFIKQANPNSYAFNALADSTIGPDHLWGMSLVKVGFRDSLGASVAGLNIEANGGYTVQGCEFDIAAQNVGQALRMSCPDQANIYNNKITLYCNGVSGLGARLDGVYNTFDLFITATATTAVESWAASSLFLKVITENAQIYNGYDCDIHNAKVEQWAGNASPFAAISVNGTNNTLVNWAVIRVPNGKANCALNINGKTRQTILRGWIKSFGENDCPQYSIVLGDESAGVLADINSDSPIKIDFKGWDVVKHWELLGDVATITDFKRLPNRLRYRWAVAGSGDTVVMKGHEDALYLQGQPAVVTVQLPPNPDDGQVFRFGTTSAVPVVNWSPGAGKTVDGQIPTSFDAGGSTAMMYLGSQGQSRWVPIS